MGACWTLAKWLYGRRPAARACEGDCAMKFETLEMQRGNAVPTSLIRGVADPHACPWRRLLGRRPGPKSAESVMSKVRVTSLGWEADDDKEVVIQGQMVRWGHAHPGGVVQRPGVQRHRVCPCPCLCPCPGSGLCACLCSGLCPCLACVHDRAIVSHCHRRYHSRARFRVCA